MSLASFETNIAAPAKNNWWDTTYATAIEAQILDILDDPSLYEAVDPSTPASAIVAGTGPR